MDVRTERVYGTVSLAVSAGDGVAAKNLLIQPLASGVSPGLLTWSEMLRRLETRIESPSATLVSGGSAGAVAITVGITAPTSGIYGRIQGYPFFVSFAGNPSAQPTSAASTTSAQVRKVLVTIAISNLAQGLSSLALSGATVQFVYGSAFATSAGIVLSGGVSATFDLVPLPLPSAGEIPMGWLNIPNSFAASAGVSASMMLNDWVTIQGLNLSALLVGVPQP